MGGANGIDMHALDRTATLAQFVTQNPATARVFQKRGMDYCCHGDVSVAEACRRASFDAEVVFAELEEVIRSTPAGSGADGDPRALPMAALIARIVDRHHGYARSALANIEPIAAKVARVHGPKDPGLLELHAAFTELSAALLPHLDEEETELFPALLAAGKDRRQLHRELERMLADHLAVGDLLARIRSLANGFSIPEWGCTTYRVLMTELEALEADTLRHVHLENHVLVPLASSAA
jgi:regulator of cell morphogenesis and NO signaling